jgi:hypothetical protein
MSEYKLAFHANVNRIEKHTTYVTANGWLFHCTDIDDDHNGFGLLLNPHGDDVDDSCICGLDNRIHSKHATPDELTLVAKVTDLTSENEG